MESPREQVTLQTLPNTGWEYCIILFYNYVRIDEPSEYRDVLRAKCIELGITGRFIIAHEGINGIGETTVPQMIEFCNWFIADPRFANTHLKFSQSPGASFPRLSVKVRPEIVSLHLGIEDFDPNETTGQKLSPAELHEWYTSGREFTIVDMRNDYEHAIGHFVGSVLPSLSNFRDLAGQLDSLAPYDDPEKPLLTVYTGGVRCEKASGYLVKKGFHNVYQLDGGMVSYMEQFPGHNFLGGMYTFDGRRVIDWDGGNHIVIGRCEHCNCESERMVDCLNPMCNRQYIACAQCDSDINDAYCTNECRAHGPAVKSDGTPAKPRKDKVAVMQS